MRTISHLLLLSCIFMVQLGILNAQNNTDISLFLKKDSSVYLNEIYSETGDLFMELGHHGPAVENEWMGLRIYFDKKATIDVYSKANPGMELKQTRWYPSQKEQKNGYGADYYKVGNTIGLGGVRLWDGEKVVPLNPVSGRTARLVKEKNSSYMEMLSEGIPYKGEKIDVLFRVTVYSGHREAKVEAFALTNKNVQFITGINFHKGQEVVEEKGHIVVWGLHPEDVAAESVEVGAAICFNPGHFGKKLKTEDEHLLISKPVKHLSWEILSVCAKDKELNNLAKFEEFVHE